LGNINDILGQLFGAALLAFGMGPFLALVYAKEVLFFAGFGSVLIGGGMALFGSRKWALRLVVLGAVTFAVSLSVILYSAYAIHWSVLYNDYYSARLPQWFWVDKGAEVFALAGAAAFGVGLLLAVAGVLRFAAGRKRRPKKLLFAGLAGMAFGIDLGFTGGISSLFAIPLDVVFSYAIFAVYNAPPLVIAGIILWLCRKVKWAVYFLVAGSALGVTVSTAIVASSFRIGWWW
jgi:hypothetical protein